MNIGEICRRGYFDKVIIDGYMIPMYNNTGLQLNMGESLTDALNNNNQIHTQGVGKLRINILGEVNNYNSKDEHLELMNMRYHREQQLKLQKRVVGTIEQYIIAYVDILILKSDNTLPIAVIQKGKSEDDLIKLAKSEDELNILIEAIKIQHKFQDSLRNSDCNIAIIDKIYVYQAFRRCRIASWIHKNIYEIVKTYALLDIIAVLLIPGDFSKCAEREFNLNKKDYKELLINHYLDLGYNWLKEDIMYKHIELEPKPEELRTKKRNKWLHIRTKKG